MTPEPLPDDDPPAGSAAGLRYSALVVLIATAVTAVCWPKSMADAAAIFLLVVLGMFIARLFH